MIPSTPGIDQALCENLMLNVDQCIDKINHCTGQLSDEQIWWRPHEAMNSIGNILLHVCGNMTQWIISGVQEKTDTRDRPGEFAERGPIARDELLRRLDATASDVKRVLQELPHDQLLAARRIQGFAETALSALTHSTHHLAGHTQEIIYITRLQLKEHYQFAWQPRTKEEGKED